ncbi:MAG: 7-cyano-7-deazaguanine synthase QueC [Anaerovibrio sp.]|nr:7-cyano-7-deazaguanine synthase QueC [Anaerovibrio sp.]
MEKAVVLLSGGLDSTVCMAVARSKGLEVYPISFNYHQRHSIELESAKKVAAFYNVKKHLIIETNMEAIGGSALTDDKIAVPDGDFDHGAEDIPITYVPARNLIFLSYAMGYAEVIGANQVFIGVNAVDYSGYPDCRPEFIASFQKTANLATKAGTADAHPISIATPLQNLSGGRFSRIHCRRHEDHHRSRPVPGGHDRVPAQGRCRMLSPPYRSGRHTQCRHHSFPLHGAVLRWLGDPLQGGGPSPAHLHVRNRLRHRHRRPDPRDYSPPSPVFSNCPDAADVPGPCRCTDAGLCSSARRHQSSRKKAAGAHNRGLIP